MTGNCTQSLRLKPWVKLIVALTPFAVAGCALSPTGTTPPPTAAISVAITAPVNPNNVSVQADIGSQNFTASVSNDAQNGGVTWTLSGTGCSGAACGSLSNSSSASGVAIIYMAPPSAPPATVTLTAASVTDRTKTASATITVTPAVSVAMSSPASSNVNVQAETGTLPFSATVTNDSQNAGVNWALGGSGCTGSACGTLSGTASQSATPVTYTAPTKVPSPATVTLTATSATDKNKTVSWNIILTSPVSITISSPANPNVNVQAEIGKQPFTATVANDAQAAGVAWTLSGAGCSGAACGTLSSSASASGAPVSYAAPVIPPTPATVTITATSVTDPNQTAAATINITPAVSVSVSATAAFVPETLTAQATATVSNDAQNKGVNWTLSGNGCTGAACGTVSPATSASGVAVTYTAPSSVPSPASVTLTATSVTDSAQSNAASITITLPISVTITPPYVGSSPAIPVYYPTFASNSYPLQAGQSESFVATVQNDPGNLGVTWSVSSPGITCPSSSCISLADVTTSGVGVIAPAPAGVPVGQSPIQFTLTATSVVDPTKSVSVTIPVSNGIPTATGWFEIPKTLLRPVCPSIPQILGADGCQAIFSAWNGAIGDTAGARLLFTGGGHQNYWGNEIYSLGLNPSNPGYLAVTQLNQPVFPTPIPPCTEDWGNPSATPAVPSTPAARENYGDLAYMPGANKVWLFGGALATSGCRSHGMWTMDLATLAWTRLDTTLTIVPSGSVVLGTTPTDINYSDTDPASGLVYSYIADADILTSYNPATNTMTALLTGAFHGTNYRANGIFDPGRNIFLLAGQGTLAWFDLNTSPPTFHNPATAICVSPDSYKSAQDANSPGLAYDPTLDRIIGWAGGSTVYVIDTRQATAVTPTIACNALTSYPNGPQAEQINGTFGRFRYFPSSDIFVLLNDWAQNAFALRLPNPLPPGF